MSDFLAVTERLMRMDEAVWARHANPLSVYSRFTCLPLLALAVWSRVWLGWWALVPVAGAIFWTWYNPRAFSPPRRIDNWASKGVLGERLFLARRQTPVPEQFVRWAHLLAGLSLIGLAILVSGLVTLHIWATICGLIATVLPKVWFVDRMVWLYDTAGAPVENRGSPGRR